MRSTLVQRLQAHGKDVREREEALPYVGNITLITEDGRFAVQNLGGDWVAVHDLAQLDGQYQIGQLCEIRYKDGRGIDKKQDAKELERSQTRGDMRS